MRNRGVENKSKQFFNNYPPKLMNKIKTHSVYYKKEQLAQINILFLNMHLDSVLIPDSNPFISIDSRFYYLFVTVYI